MSARRFKIRSDDSLHMPDDSHYIHTHSVIFFYHARLILVFEGIIKYVKASVTNTKMSSLVFLFLLENQTQSLRNVFSLPFHSESVKRGAKLRLS